MHKTGDRSIGKYADNRDKNLQIISIWDSRKHHFKNLTLSIRHDMGQIKTDADTIGAYINRISYVTSWAEKRNLEVNEKNNVRTN